MNDELMPKILSRLARQSYLTARELAESLDVPRLALTLELERLRKRGLVSRRCRADRSWVWWLPELEGGAKCDLEEMRATLMSGEGLTHDQGMALVREVARMRNEVVSMRVDVELIKARSRR